MATVNSVSYLSRETFTELAPEFIFRKAIFIQYNTWRGSQARTKRVKVIVAASREQFHLSQKPFEPNNV